MGKGIGWPLDRNFIRRGSQRHTFGMVRRNADNTRRPHQGWDFEAEAGTPCYAVAKGVVSRVYTSNSYGRCVVIKFTHDYDDDGDADTLYAFYAHLSAAQVKEGDTVELGDKIGLTGNTGNAVSMKGMDQHLHFEVRTKRIPRRGLHDRYSPMVIFGLCPWKSPLYRTEGGG